MFIANSHFGSQSVKGVPLIGYFRLNKSTNQQKGRFSAFALTKLGLSVFTSYHGRRTRVMGSHGDIVGDMSKYVHTDFLTGKKTEWEMESDGHGGGDWNLVADWVQAVSKQDSSLLTSSIDASVESHVMGFVAEKSRLGGETEKVIL